MINAIAAFAIFNRKKERVMKIYEVVSQDNRGSRPDQNIEVTKVWGETPQEAVDKVRTQLGITKDDTHITIVCVNEIVKQYDWE